MRCARAAVRATNFSRLPGDEVRSAEQQVLALADSSGMYPPPLPPGERVVSEAQGWKLGHCDSSPRFSNPAPGGLPSLTPVPALFQGRQLWLQETWRQNWFFFPKSGLNFPHPRPRPPTPKRTQLSSSQLAAVDAGEVDFEGSSLRRTRGGFPGMWAAGLAFPQESGDPHSKKLSEFNRLGSWLMFPASDASGLLWRRQGTQSGREGSGDHWMGAAADLPASCEISRQGSQVSLGDLAKGAVE